MMVIKTQLIGIGALVATLLVGSVSYGQAQAPQNDQERQMLRELVRRNAMRQMQMAYDEYQKYGHGNVPLTDGEGNEYTWDEAVEMVLGRRLAADAGQQEGQGDAKLVDGPLLVVVGDEHDFGVVPEKAELVHRFTFRNAGNEPLIIEKINTGCGCTVAKLAKHEYAPGEVGHIDITYKPKGVGAQKRTIQVMTNDARRRITTLLLKTEVVPIVAARPPQVQLGAIPIGEVREVYIEVVSRDKNLKILGANINGAEVATEIVEDPRPKGLLDPQLPGYGQVKLTLLGNADVGRLLRQLTIDVLASDGEGKPQQNRSVRVSVYAMIKGHLVVEPPFMRVKPLKPDEAFTKESIVYQDEGKPFRILDAKVTGANIDAKVSFEPTERSGKPAYKVILTGKSGRVASRFRGKVVLTTDVERERVIELDFSGLVRAPSRGTR